MPASHAGPCRGGSFFVEVIGCEAFYELDPFGSQDDWMQKHLKVHPRTIMRRLRVLR